MKIAFTGGGTAGHAMVNTILIPYLQKKECSIIYIGSHNGMEQDMVQPIAEVTYFGISTGKLRRYFSFRNLTDIFRIVRGCAEAYKILKSERPHVLYSGGGYVSVPVVFAAKCLHIPVLIRETDLSIGLANRLCLPFAEIIFTTFPDTEVKLVNKASLYPGVLIRPELYARRLMQDIPMKQNKPLCLVLGGSMGARKINETIWSSIDYLTYKYQVLHVCGKGKMNKEIEENLSYKQFEYIHDEMGALLNAADVVVTRCGSNAIWEMLALGKKTVCIPIPSKSSRGEQKQNASFAVSNGNAVLLEEAYLNGNSLCHAIEEVLSMNNKTPFQTTQRQLDENIQKHISQIYDIGRKQAER